MTYHRVKYYFAYSFVVIFGIILYFAQEIGVRGVVFIEFFSYVLGVVFLSYHLLIAKNKHGKDLTKSMWNIVKLFLFPFVFSFLFSNIAGSYLIIKNIPDGMSTSSMNFLIALVYLPLLIIFCILFRNDRIFVKRVVFVATLYISALINRIILYVINGAYSGMLLIEVISIISTVLLYSYINSKKLHTGTI